jgi:cytochrome c nitrite reductase small subunit
MLSGPHADQEDERERVESIPRWLKWTSALAVAIFVGAGLFTFERAGGASYLREDPSACMNCHIMRDQYAAWQQGRHARFATCNDCHTGNGLVAHYSSKAVNGFAHAWAFTTGRFHEPLQIHAFNRRIAEANCRRCHAGLAVAVDGFAAHAEAGACLRCHADVGH